MAAVSARATAALWAAAWALAASTPAIAAAADPGTPAGTRALQSFTDAPIGARLAALGHVPLLARPLATGELAVAVYAPEQGALSNWDDESRIVLYRRVAADYERVQFVSKAGQSVPGRLAELVVRDVDGDGVEELVAIGRAQGPVHKATLMIFRRAAVANRFDVLFRRRERVPALRFAPGGQLTFSYEPAAGPRRAEIFQLDGGAYVPQGGQTPPIDLE